MKAKLDKLDLRRRGLGSVLGTRVDAVSVYRIGSLRGGSDCVLEFNKFKTEIKDFTNQLRQQ